MIEFEDYLLVAKLSTLATIPTRASEHSAGYDLYAAYDVFIAPHGKSLLLTDIAISLPKNTYGRIAPRSGLAVKHFIDVGAGVIDYDYRGNVGVLLFNFSDVDYKVSCGDRIAQLIVERNSLPKIVQVDEVEITGRGFAGFGSSGK